jgi:hypothetical protein
MNMFGAISFDERRVRHALGVLYKAMILGTLGSLFSFAPLKEARNPANSKHRVAIVEEVPEVGNAPKVVWLDSARVVRGQGDSFRPTFEE